METLNWNRAASAGEPAPGVAEAVLDGLRAGSPGRGASDGGAGERRRAARARLARLLGSSHPGGVAFGPGATFALNLALHGLVQPGQTVLTTRLEHNAVLRPLEALRRRGAEVVQARFDAHGFVDPAEWERLLAAHRPAWAVVCLASNVIGTIQPLAELGPLARAAGAGVIADLAQGAGQIPVAFDAWGLSAAAVAAHKGLGGPRGIGALLLARDCAPEPLLQGGTGTHGASREMPAEMPGRYEAGTPNLPGIYGLEAAVRRLEAGLPDLGPARAGLSALEEKLRAETGWRPLPAAGAPWERRLPVLALDHPAVPVAAAAAYLAQLGVHVRGGLQCAPDVCADSGAPRGVLRLSPPLDADEAQFARVAAALRETEEALA